MAKEPLTIKGRTLGGQPFFGEKVDILLPFHGQYHSVTRLIESIVAATRTNRYKICLIDDASPNSAYIESLKDVPYLATVRNPRQLGFSGSLAMGFQSTNSPWVVFMHSDCIVRDHNWLLEMGRSLIKDPKIGLVSARTNNPLDGDPRLKADISDKSNDVVLEDGHLPLICTMCHRSLFEKIGGFLKPYPYAFYEDEELAFRMRMCGYKQVVCGKSWIHHEGGMTVNSLLQENPEVQKVIDGNREKCMTHMAETVELFKKKNRRASLFG